MKYIKKFENHNQYNAFTATTDFILPNVSTCIQENHVHYNPLKCEESTFYRLTGETTYPSTIKGNDNSFKLSFGWEQVHIYSSCMEEITDNGNEEVVCNVGLNPSTANSRSISGSYRFNNLDIPYEVTQEESIYNITSVFETTAGSKKILNYPSNFASVIVDGRSISPITSAYTFSRGTHTVKYLTSNVLPEGALINCKEMTSVTLSDGVESISDIAFSNCSDLKNITIPNTVKSIGEKAFYFCTTLPSINIPDSVTSIGKNAFERCYSATTCTIGDGVTDIGDEAFFFCRSLTSVTIGNNVKVIGYRAFGQLFSLTNVSIPDSVKTIGQNVFNACSALTTCTIGSGVTSISDGIFWNCSGLTSVTIKATTPPTLGGTYAFYNTNNCPIYVPSESVSAYKSASVWSSYASRIQAIP